MLPFSAFAPYLSRTPPTHWSAVGRLAQPATRLETEAEEFVKIYWGPLYAEARQNGVSHEQAADAAQEVMAKLFSHGELAKIRQERGRLRHFLHTLIQNECNLMRRRESALKRGGGATLISMDEAAQSRCREAWDEISSQTSDPGEASRRIWASSLMDMARQVMENRYARRGRQEIFNGLVRSLGGLHARIGYRQLGESLGMSEVSLAKRVHRFRAEFGEVLRAVVSESLCIPPGPELDDEIRALFLLRD